MTKKSEVKPRFQTNYDPQYPVAVGFSEPSRTKQSFKEECDINNVMKKFERTGILPDLIKSNPQYGDFSDPLDFQESSNIVAHANEQFAALSAKIRDRFGNSPQAFLEFATNPENEREMVRLGLATRRPVEEKQEASKSVPKEPSAPKAPKKESGE